MGTLTKAPQQSRSGAKRVFGVEYPMNLLIALMLVAAVAMVLTTLSLLILLMREFNRQSQQSIGVKPKTPRSLNLQNPSAQTSSSRQPYQKPTKPTQSSLPLQQTPRSQPPPKQPIKSTNMRVSSQTRTKLIQLAGHDVALADRLVKKVHTNHPDRSAQWCWEKAICDLERDRRY